MSTENVIAALARSPHFRGVPTEVLHGLSMAAEVQTMQPGEVIGTRLQPSEAVWLIADGRVEVRRLQGYQGRRFEVAVAILKPGMIFGHVGLLAEQPRTGTWVASSPGVLVRFDRKAFERLIADPRQTGSAFRRGLVLALAVQLSAVNQQLDAFIRNQDNEVATRRELLRSALASVDATEGE